MVSFGTRKKISKIIGNVVAANFIGKLNSSSLIKDLETIKTESQMDQQKTPFTNNGILKSAKEVALEEIGREIDKIFSKSFNRIYRR